MKIDGSQKSGSGTILRQSIALASILGEDLHIYNIRKKRSQPGLRPQHLEAVLTAAKLCNAEMKGATLGSQQLLFKPSAITGGEVQAEIGTAGSIPMLLLTVLPMCVFAEHTVSITAKKGGTDVRHAPTINYLKYVLLPMLERMGLETSLNVRKYGYYPKGMGEVFLRVQPCKSLSPVCLEEFGTLGKLRGVSVCTFLADRRVAERQATAATKHLQTWGLEAKINVINDRSNPLQKGSSIVVWAESNTGTLLGGDAIGELRKPSEVVGREAAEALAKEIQSQATVDTHLADMLVPYVALADGKSAYLTRAMSDHLETNIWLAEQILDVEFHITKIGNLYRVEKNDS